MAHNQHRDDPPLGPDALPPAHPVAGGGNRNRRGPRRGGRGGGGQPGRAPPHEPNLRPPRQNVQPAGVPRPQHLATTSTPERNDPLWTTGLAGAELQPNPNLEYVFSGCETLPHITSVVHNAYSATSAGYARRVCESAFAYYAAVCTQFRLLSLQSANSFDISFQEKRFLEQVDSLRLEVPMLLAQYLAGFGNTRVPSGRDIRFRMAERTAAITAGDVCGWYGRVTEETQVLYSQYPCLAVYAARCMADLEEGPRLWRMPVAVRPQTPGAISPTKALLGYARRTTLQNAQKAFLNACGVYSDEEFPSCNHDLPLNVELMCAVHAELAQVQSLRLSPLPTSIVGSQAQLAAVRLDDELSPFRSESAILHCVYQLPAEISFSASAFGYRVKHEVEDALYGAGADPVPWVVWHFDPQHRNDWREYIEAGNALRAFEPDFLQISEFRTTSYLLRARIEALFNALTKT